MNRLLLLLFIICPPVIDTTGQSSQEHRQQPAEVRILHAESMEAPYSDMQSDGIRLIGNVRLSHEDILMECDSAHRYSGKNIVHAFGNVHINQGDTLHLYGDHLIYYGDKRYTEVRRNVLLRDNETTLTTEILDFDLANNFGYYPDGGVVINGDNRLESIQGYYYTDEKLFFFKDSVIITNPDYIIKSDTLKYNTVTEIAYFLGPTTIIGDDTNIYCENGWYNTKTDISQFNENARIKNNNQLLMADSIFYDNGMGLGKAFLNVEVIDTIENTIIRGNYAWFNRDPEQMLMTDRALLIQMSDKDTLYMHADTLRSWLQITQRDIKPADPGKAEPPDTLVAAVADTLAAEPPDTLVAAVADTLAAEPPDTLVAAVADTLAAQPLDTLVAAVADTLAAQPLDTLAAAVADTLAAQPLDTLAAAVADTLAAEPLDHESLSENDTVRIMVAYYGVRFFSNDMQGKCDSLYYNMRDSIVFMFGEPVVWTDDSQLTSEFMEIHSRGGEVDHIVMTNSSFVASEEEPGLYNQIKGKDILGYFRDGELYRVHVMGNAETLYYPVENEEIIGINKAASANLMIFLKDSKPDRIRFLNRPEAVLYPLEDLSDQDRILQNFVWLDHLRPIYWEDVFRK